MADEQQQQLNRADLLGVIKERRDDFADSLAGLTDEQMQQPGIYDDNNWTVKDIIAHVISWEQLQISWLVARSLGVPPITMPSRMWADTDGMNVVFYDKHADQSLADIMDTFEQSGQQIVEAVAALSEAELTNPQPFMDTSHNLYAHIVCNTYNHYPEHTEAILNWRDREGFAPLVIIPTEDEAEESDNV